MVRLTAGLQTHRVVRSHHLRVRVELHVRLSTQGPRRRRRRTRHHEQVQLAVAGQIQRDANTRALATITGQLAVSQTPPKEQKLSIQSRRWHPRVDQSAKCPVRESSSPRVGNPRVGVSASCPVTVSYTAVEGFTASGSKHTFCSFTTCKKATYAVKQKVVTFSFNWMLR